MRFSESGDRVAAKVANPVSIRGAGAKPAAIQYFHPTTNNRETKMKNQTIQLSNGKHAPRWIYDDVLAKVQTAIPKLVPGIDYRLEKIYGKLSWSRLDKGERILAGQCMVHLANKELVPLEYIGRASDNAALYQLK